MAAAARSRAPRVRGAAALALALGLALLLAACAQPEVAPTPPPAPAPPRSYVVLLPNADGSSGRVVYEGPAGTVELDQAGQAVPLSGGAAARYAPSPAQLQADFGAVSAARPKAPRTFLLYFDAGDTQITRESQSLLPQLLDEIANRPAPDVSIVGHTDTVGQPGANEALGRQRAEQVGRLLQPVAARVVQFEITSHGERNLLVQTPDNTAEPRNRRVEVTVR